MTKLRGLGCHPFGKFTLFFFWAELYPFGDFVPLQRQVPVTRAMCLLPNAGDPDNARYFISSLSPCETVMQQGERTPLVLFWVCSCEGGFGMLGGWRVGDGVSPFGGSAEGRLGLRYTGELLSMVHCDPWHTGYTEANF